MKAEKLNQLLAKQSEVAKTSDREMPKGIDGNVMRTGVGVSIQHSLMMAKLDSAEECMRKAAEQHSHELTKLTLGFECEQKLHAQAVAHLTQELERARADLSDAKLDGLAAIKEVAKLSGQVGKLQEKITQLINLIERPSSGDAHTSA